MAIKRTVRELLERSLRLTGAFAVGETIEGSDISIALKVFQDVLAEHAGDMFMPYLIQEAITLVVGQTVYTIGESSTDTPDLNSQRPEQIVTAFVRTSGNFDYPVEVIDERNYAAIPAKTTSSSRPEKLWYNATAPNGTISLYPVPDAAEALWISSIKSLTEPTSLTADLLDTVSIPRNYHNPLAWILALELVVEYEGEATITLLSQAEKAVSSIIALNLARTLQPAIIEPGTRGKDVGRTNSILSF